MGDDKNEFLIPLKAEAKDIISDHLLQVVEDENLSIRIGTFNTSWNAECAIEVIGDQKHQPFETQHLDRVRRSVNFLNTVKEEIKDNGLQSNLAIIGLQKSAKTPEGATNDTALWGAANLEENLPNWGKVTQDSTTPTDVANAILYDKELVKPVEQAFNLTGLNPELARRVQVAAFKNKEASDEKAFLVYNVHLPHSDDPAVAERAITAIQDLPQNAHKTYYIIGDFGGSFHTTEAALVDNGTSVVPGLDGQKSRGCTDAIFKGTGSKCDRLNTQVANYTTGHLEDLPEISQKTAESDTFYSPTCYGSKHLIRDFFEPTYTTSVEPLINEIVPSLSISSRETVSLESKRSIMHEPEPVFLEKNRYNLPRIAINYSSLSQSQQMLLMSLKVDIVEADKPADGQNSVIPKRFVLYPHKGRDYDILLQLPLLLHRLQSKIQSSHNLERWAKIFAAIATMFAIASAILFILSAGFAPAILLIAGAGILGIAAGVMYALGKYRGTYLFSNEKPLAYGFAAAGTTIAVGAALAWGFAPAIAFVGIPLAPIVLAFMVAAIFLVTAIAAFKAKPVAPDFDKGATQSDIFYEIDFGNDDVNSHPGRSMHDIQLALTTAQKSDLKDSLSTDSSRENSFRENNSRENSSSENSSRENSSLVTSQSTLFSSRSNSDTAMQNPDLDDKNQPRDGPT